MAWSSARVRLSRKKEAALWLRRMRAVCKFNCGKERCVGAPSLVQQGTAVGSGRAGREYRTKVSLGEELRALKEEFCYARRRSGREHAETCEGFEFEQVVSCGRSDRRWRTKLDFDSRESFEDHHRSTAFGTAPETAQAMGA